MEFPTILASLAVGVNFQVSLRTLTEAFKNHAEAYEAKAGVITAIATAVSNSAPNDVLVTAVMSDPLPYLLVMVGESMKQLAANNVNTAAHSDALVRAYVAGHVALL